MEYPKNNMYFNNGTFSRRVMPNMQVSSSAAFAGTEPKNFCIEGASLAMVYSPLQQFEKLYEPMEALRQGTLFCKLYMPFTGNRR